MRLSMQNYHHLTYALSSLQAMFNEGDASMDSFDLSQFNFLDESMDDLDLTDAKADDTENNFSESESNLETADPEEFDRILLKGHRTVASSMGAFWGSVLAPTASEKYSRHSPARTSSHDIDLGVHQSPRLLSEAVVDRKMVTRSVSAPEIDFQQGSRQGANRAARGPTPSNEIPVRRLLKNTSARIDQPREEFTTTVSSGEDPNPSISPE
jgi:hypothetical protein